MRIELNGAVLSKRLEDFITSEGRLKFVDSEIVRAIIQKESCGFNTFVAVRVGEIEDHTNPQNWYWIDGKLNIAGWITRVKNPDDLGPGSTWQNGPEFLKLPEEEWPIKQDCTFESLPEEANKVFTLCVEDSLTNHINIDRFSSYTRLIRVTARVIAMYRRNPKLSFKNATEVPDQSMLKAAKLLWTYEAQHSIRLQVEQGQFKRLCPKIRENGVVAISGRVEKWTEISYDMDGNQL